MSGIILIVLYTVAVFAPFFSPYPFDEFHGKVKFAPPQRIRVFDEDGQTHGPFYLRVQAADGPGDPGSQLSGGPVDTGIAYVSSFAASRTVSCS